MLLIINELSLLILIAAVSLLQPIADGLYTNTSSIQELVYRVSAEKVATQPPLPGVKKPNKKARLVSIIRSLLSKEVKSLENSITDSVMEEVINYYGAKLDTAVNMGNEVAKLQKQLETLNQTVAKLDRSYEQIDNSHQSLVNTVRSSISNAKRLREKYLRLKFTTALKRKTLRNMEDSARPEITTNKPAVVVQPQSLKLQIADEEPRETELDEANKELDSAELVAEPMVPNGSISFLFFIFFV